MKDKITIRNKILQARSYEAAVSLQSNTYLGIGVVVEWDSEDTLIPEPLETTSNTNKVFRDLVSIKKIIASDINLVIPRVDWESNIVYSEYTDELEIYSYDSLESLSGLVSANVDSSILIGTNTSFSTELAPGDIISISGDGINSPKVKKEIVNINSANNLSVNSKFTSTYTDNSYFRITNTYPKFSNNFYVRNNRDQIFKCLFNNGAATSTEMPEINIGGQLPENAFIETSDGYRWKYMYTIPSGLKEKFFTKDWMPVVIDPLVASTSRNGRLDILKVVASGNGYIASGNSVSANIINVIGDGAEASITATVANGRITAVNVLDGGFGYTEAEIKVLDPTKTPGTVGDDALILATIGPQNGHGADVVYELGAANIMISVDLDSDVDGTIPTENLVGENFDYRQLSLVKNPITTRNVVASNNSYTLAKIVNISQTASNFNLDEIVYQGTTLAESTFSGRVVFWDTQRNQLWLNDTRGTFQEVATLVGTIQTNPVTAFSVIDSDIVPFTGELLYIENRSSIVRDNDQVEQIKIIVSF